MTPDERRQRAAIDRVCQRMSDEYDARLADRAETRRRHGTALRWLGVLMGAGAGAYCLYTLIVMLVTP
jgi:hypothetical protein